MSVTEFGTRPCERVRRYLDSYLSNELLVETNHEVLRHLESCRECTAALGGRARVRQALQSAVRADRAPAALEARIRADLGRRAPRRRLAGLQWSLSLAASAVVLLAGWAIFRSVTLREGPSGERAAAILGLGVNDHVECAVTHGLEGRRLTAEQMTEALGPDYAELVPAVRAQIPAGYDIGLAHRCRVGGREFVHLILEREGRILSVAITRKNGESFSRERLAASLQASGIPIYQGQVRSYQVAGFETRDHLAFVVSGLAREANASLAASLAPGVRALLARLEA